MRRLLLAGLAFSALALSGCGESGASSSSPERNPAQEAIHYARDRVYPALVMIDARWDVYQGGAKQRTGGTGSGTIIDPVGHILTNFHVAGKADVIRCHLYNKEVVGAKLVGVDPWTDLALLQVDMDEVTRKAPGAGWAVLGHSGAVQVGDLVLTMGAPLGQARSVSLGVISNIDRTLSEAFRLPTGEESGAFNVWLQTDASINPGNSGGPLVDMEGRVIGVNSRNMPNAPGIGYAVPIDVAREVIYELLAHGRVRRSWLGINFQPTQTLDQAHGEDVRGALVREVEEGSPAAVAGIKPEDLLVRLDGEPVAGRFPDEIFELRRHIARIPVGKSVEAVVARGGKEIRLRMITEELSPSLGEDKVYPAWGLSVKALTDRMSRQLDLDVEKGIYVTGVRGAAARAGLLEKDVIVKMGDQEVATLAALDAVYARMAQGKAAHLKVQAKRGRNTIFASLRVEKTEKP